MKEKLTIEQIAPYFQYRPLVQYNGILNGKEISEWDKLYDHLDLFEPHPVPFPKTERGIKYGHIKRVEYWKNGYIFYIGKKARGLKKFYDVNEFKLCLRPLSDLSKHIKHNGNSFRPLDVFYIEFGGGYSSISSFQNDFLMNIKYSQNDTLSYTIIKKLYEWHFAINIPDHLYIDINTI